MIYIWRMAVNGLVRRSSIQRVSTAGCLISYFTCPFYAKTPQLNGYFARGHFSSCMTLSSLIAPSALFCQGL